jgi:hypothetical protein
MLGRMHACLRARLLAVQGNLADVRSSLTAGRELIHSIGSTDFIMDCPRCGARNREGSNFCRNCAFALPQQSAESNSGYIPSVPPPGESAYRDANRPTTAEPPPPLPAVRPAGLVCPRCGSAAVIPARIPAWAIVTTILGFFLVCFFSFFFLLIKEPNKCSQCGLEFK